MTVEYAIRCDGCGRVIATSRSSARAARAVAQLERGAYSGAGQDWCASCRSKRNAASAVTKTPRGHSISASRRPV